MKIQKKKKVSPSQLIQEEETIKKELNDTSQKNEEKLQQGQQAIDNQSSNGDEENIKAGKRILNCFKNVTSKIGTFFTNRVADIKSKKNQLTSKNNSNTSDDQDNEQYENGKNDNKQQTTTSESQPKNKNTEQTNDDTKKSVSDNNVSSSDSNNTKTNKEQTSTNKESQKNDKQNKTNDNKKDENSKNDNNKKKNQNQPQKEKISEPPQNNKSNENNNNEPSNSGKSGPVITAKQSFGKVEQLRKAGTPYYAMFNKTTNRFEYTSSKRGKYIIDQSNGYVYPNETTTFNTSGTLDTDVYIINNNSYVDEEEHKIRLATCDNDFVLISKCKDVNSKIMELKPKIEEKEINNLPISDYIDELNNFIKEMDDMYKKFKDLPKEEQDEIRNSCVK